MVRLIMGANGAGKTKQLIELIHAAVESENGSVVCIEPSADMTYDISYNVRLVNAGEYNVNNYECLRGFISGLYAGNYDISHSSCLINWLFLTSQRCYCAEEISASTVRQGVGTPPYACCR